VKKSDIKRIVSVFCAMSVIAAFAACKQEDKPAETSFVELTPTPIPVETTTTPTTTIPVYSGPLPSSDIAVTSHSYVCECIRRRVLKSKKGSLHRI